MTKLGCKPKKSSFRILTPNYFAMFSVSKIMWNFIDKATLSVVQVGKCHFGDETWNLSWGEAPPWDKSRSQSGKLSKATVRQKRQLTSPKILFKFYLFIYNLFLWVEEKSTFEETSRFLWEFFLSLKAFLNELQETVVVGVITLHLKEHFN